MADSITITCQDGSTFEFVPMAQGVASVATAQDLVKDAAGYTNPNLHRRVDPTTAALTEDELALRQYTLGVYGVDSYRTTKYTYHDEASTTSEIP